ncbi:MAG: hypothetical protein K6G28_05655 [Acholeplasmatales bacterium]|nr:hypothetical protein [Acholeplasmatales bacterium]
MNKNIKKVFIGIGAVAALSVVSSGILYACNNSFANRIDNVLEAFKGDTDKGDSEEVSETTEINFEKVALFLLRDSYTNVQLFDSNSTSSVITLEINLSDGNNLIIDFNNALIAYKLGEYEGEIAVPEFENGEYLPYYLSSLGVVDMDIIIDVSSIIDVNSFSIQVFDGDSAVGIVNNLMQDEILSIFR